VHPDFSNILEEYPLETTQRSDRSANSTRNALGVCRTYP
jgi:hypothetical protein